MKQVIESEGPMELAIIRLAKLALELEAEVKQLKQERDIALQALQPFVDYHEHSIKGCYWGHREDDYTMIGCGGLDEPGQSVDVGHFRKAAEAQAECDRRNGES